MFDNEKRILPAFPRTPYLTTTGMGKDDVLIRPDEVPSNLVTYVEEKLDGANCGMALVDGQPIIRNRDHILRKGYMKDTKSKKQFASVWTWFYDNWDKFEELEELHPNLSVYGEWLYAMHTVYYDELPDIFIAYDLYDYKNQKFLNTDTARSLLYMSGFSTPVLLESNFDGFEIKFDKLIGKQSGFSRDLHEGIYIKMCNEDTIVQRMKMIRPGFVQPDNWLNTPLVRNKRLGGAKNVELIEITIE